MHLVGFFLRGIICSEVTHNGRLWKLSYESSLIKNNELKPSNTKTFVYSAGIGSLFI